MCTWLWSDNSCQEIGIWVFFYFAAAAAKWFARQLSLTDRLRNACIILFHDFSVLVFPSHSANICLQAVLESCLVSCSILFNSVDWTPNWRPISNHLVDILGVTISVRLAISVWILDEINKLVIHRLFWCTYLLRI